MNTIDSWQMRYQRIGIKTIPLWNNSKLPVCAEWQHKAEYQQWQESAALGNTFANVGLLADGSFVVVDCDTPSAKDNVLSGLAALGINAPSVITPKRGGLHIYLKASGVPGDLNSPHLAKSVGAGELRVRNCQVAAPCSRLSEGRYKFTPGTSPEDLEAMKSVRWTDLAWLIDASRIMRTTGASTISIPPLRLTYRELSAYEIELFDALGTANKGKECAGYPTRSEAEAALIACLILKGWPFADIAQEFERRQPGHFREANKPDAYLRRVYRSVLTVIASTPERTELASMYAAASATPWPGRGGGGERVALMAVVAKAWQFASSEVRASQRELCEHAACSRKGLANALERLKRGGYIAQKDGGSDVNGSLWSVSKVAISNIPYAGGVRGKAQEGDGSGLDVGEGARDSGGGFENSQNSTNVSDRTNVLSVLVCDGAAELWRRDGLGKSAALVFAALGGGEAITRADIELRTGKSKRTVYRALDKLGKEGLAVQVDDDHWQRGGTPLAEVADKLLCAQAAKRRRTRHDEERRHWQYGLEHSKGHARKRSEARKA